VRTRPPEPPASDDEDPVERMNTLAEKATRQRALQAESLLGGAPAVELTDGLRGSGWPGAAKTLAELLVLDGLPEQPYRINFGDALNVDADGAVTYSSPVSLTRVETRTARTEITEAEVVVPPVADDDEPAAAEAAGA
jgi:hypothetical protein